MVRAEDAVCDLLLKNAIQTHAKRGCSLKNVAYVKATVPPTKRPSPLTVHVPFSALDDYPDPNHMPPARPVKNTDESTMEGTESDHEVDLLCTRQRSVDLETLQEVEEKPGHRIPTVGQADDLEGLSLEYPTAEDLARRNATDNAVLLMESGDTASPSAARNTALEDRRDVDPS
ncbi:hypothetical protein K474DRAFT_1708452 [Panus rudis PR-1116 ss-1]|nr:hypothetical protein K474DRAFT_1708452 [Panus rudis PR-1116 ss-1]